MKFARYRINWQFARRSANWGIREEESPGGREVVEMTNVVQEAHGLSAFLVLVSPPVFLACHVLG